MQCSCLCAVQLDDHASSPCCTGFITCLRVQANRISHSGSRILVPFENLPFLTAMIRHSFYAPMLLNNASGSTCRDVWSSRGRDNGATKADHAPRASQTPSKSQQRHGPLHRLISLLVFLRILPMANRELLLSMNSTVSCHGFKPRSLSHMPSLLSQLPLLWRQRLWMPP